MAFGRLLKAKDTHYTEEQTPFRQNTRKDVNQTHHDHRPVRSRKSLPEH